MNKDLGLLRVSLDAMNRRIRSRARQIAELAAELAAAADIQPPDAITPATPMTLAVTSPAGEDVVTPDTPSDDATAPPAVTEPDPSNADDWTPVRRYLPGSVDQILVQQRAVETREREKAEANRPTGTEIAQITRKLDELTKQLAEQQKQLKAAQELLAAQQEQLKTQQDTLSDQQRQLKAAQDQLGTQQGQLSSIVSQLSDIVGSQGDTVQTLQNITSQLQSQQAYLDDLQNKVLVTIKLNFDTVFRRLDALDHQGV